MPARAATALLLIAALTTCNRAPAPAPAAPASNYGKMEVVTPTTPADQTYTVRAVIVGLPASGRAYLELHHEEIPTFVSRDGSVEAMKEMIMDFPSIQPTVALAPFTVGDKVEVTFQMRWKSEPRSIVTAISKLPAETPLNLSEVTEGK